MLFWFQAMRSGVVGPNGLTQSTMSTKAHTSNQTLQSPHVKKQTELEKGNAMCHINWAMEHTVQVFYVAFIFHCSLL